MIIFSKNFNTTIKLLKYLFENFIIKSTISDKTELLCETSLWAARGWYFGVLYLPSLFDSVSSNMKKVSEAILKVYFSSLALHHNYNKKVVLLFYETITMKFLNNLLLKSKNFYLPVFFSNGSYCYLLLNFS